jgi:hypothetical protein
MKLTHYIYRNGTNSTELSLSWESASGSATQEFLSMFYGTRRFSAVFTLVLMLSQINPLYIIPYYIRSIQILSSDIWLGYLNGLFFLAFPRKSYMHSSSFHACYMFFPSQPSCLVLSNSNWRRVEVTKLLIMQFSSTSYHSSPVQSKYSPQYPVIKHPQSVPPLTSEAQVSHPYTHTSVTFLTTENTHYPINVTWYYIDYWPKCVNV